MNLELKEIDLSKRDGCKHPDINAKDTYLVDYEGALILGKFEKEWYGWNFYWHRSCDCGLELDALKRVFKVEPASLKRLKSR